MSDMDSDSDHESIITDGSDYDFEEESEDMDIDIDDFGVEEADDNVDAEYLKESDMDALMAEGILKLKEISGLCDEASWAVLEYFRWKIEDAISNALDDIDVTLKKAGVRIVNGVCNHLAKLPPAECSVCLDDDTPVLAMPCGHAACGGCWQQYMDNEIESGNVSFTCVAPECNLVCLNNAIASICTAQANHQHVKNQREKFLTCSRNLKWCPSPDCNTVIKRDGGGDVVCKACDEPFCFKCGFDHAPASCADVKAFSAKNAVESKDVVWLIKNSKECPSCFANISKDGGCNWVRCSKCKYEFCWLCFKQIKHSEIDAAGGSHRCNSFNGEVVVEVGPKDAGIDHEKRKAEKEEHRRLAHYYQRYEAHKNSAKLEEKNSNKHKAEALSADESRIMLMETRWNAIRRLRTARSTLCASYVFGYFQKWDLNTSAVNIFEDLQHLLESRTESLAHSVESSFMDGEGSDTESNVEKFRACLLKHMAAVHTNQTNLVDVCRADLTTSTN
eukprot:m.84700 g.84700  ORF g.84700 m.84700 type:complete len:504 (+) comp25789_c0_seq1:188-1699(+)